MLKLEQMDEDSDDERMMTNARIQFYMTIRYTWRFCDEGHRQMTCDYFNNRCLHSDKASICRNCHYTYWRP